MLTLHEATIRFGGLTAVDHVSFTVEKGQILKVCSFFIRKFYKNLIDFAGKTEENISHIRTET